MTTTLIQEKNVKSVELGIESLTFWEWFCHSFLLWTLSLPSTYVSVSKLPFPSLTGMIREPASQGPGLCGQSKRSLSPPSSLDSSELRPQCAGVPVSHTWFRREMKNIYRAFSWRGHLRQGKRRAAWGRAGDQEPTPIPQRTGTSFSLLSLLSLCSPWGPAQEHVHKRHPAADGQPSLFPGLSPKGFSYHSARRLSLLAAVLEKNLTLYSWLCRAKYTKSILNS